MQISFEKLNRRNYLKGGGLYGEKILMCKYKYRYRNIDKDIDIDMDIDINIILKNTLRFCATNWKVAGSIPAGVIGISH